MEKRSPTDEILVHDGLQPCPYLPGRVARLPLWRQRRALAPDAFDRRLARSERRVGWLLYRPECPGCRECLGIRVPIADFRPSASQRRVLRRCRGLRVEIGLPLCTPERLALFERHKRLRGLTEAGSAPVDEDGYRGWLVHSCATTIEMRYLLGDRLVGVGIVDLGYEAASSVYFYFDPDPEVADLSPGVFSVLTELDLCRRTGRRWLYLGLYVRDCSHMNYKIGYRPYEILVDGVWTRGGEAPGGEPGPADASAPSG